MAITASLLRSCGVEDVHRWCPVVTCLAVEAAASISPACVATTGSIDPRSYLKVHAPDDFLDDHETRCS